MDGAGHQTVTFALGGKEAIFHYPSTPKTCGHSRTNITARLRRMLREMPVGTAAIPDVVIDEDDATKYVPPAPTPPTGKLNSRRRKDICKRYVELRDLDQLSQETGIETERLRIIIFSRRGQAADLLRTDITQPKKAPPINQREETEPMELAEAQNAPAETSKRPARPQQPERDAEIVSAYYKGTMSGKELAELYEMGTSTLYSILQRFRDKNRLTFSSRNPKRDSQIVFHRMAGLSVAETIERMGDEVSPTVINNVMHRQRNGGNNTGTVEEEPEIAPAATPSPVTAPRPPEPAPPVSVTPLPRFAQRYAELVERYEMALDYAAGTRTIEQIAADAGLTESLVEVIATREFKMPYPEELAGRDRATLIENVWKAFTESVNSGLQALHPSVRLGR